MGDVGFVTLLEVQSTEPDSLDVVEAIKMRAIGKYGVDIACEPLGDKAFRVRVHARQDSEAVTYLREELLSTGFRIVLEEEVD